MDGKLLLNLTDLPPLVQEERPLFTIYSNASPHELGLYFIIYDGYS